MAHAVKNKLASFFAVVFSVVGVAAGQVEQGRFVGHIQDPTGAIIVGANVEATNVATNIVQRAPTNDGGDFVITPVLAGNYILTVTAQGFQKATTKVIEVQVGQIVRQDIVLPIGTANMTVEVTTATPLLSTDSATVGTVLTNKQVVDLPVNGRGFYRLAQLTPGATLLPPTGNSLAIRPEVVNGNVISGIRGSATSFLMDGVDVSEQHQGGTFIQTSIDALQEFSVVQSPYSAEYNRGGAFFNATTKPGTNRYHGVLFEFLRNDALDARNYFSLTRQRQKRNQFGGNLGGPLSIPHLYTGRDRTFFFFNFEGQRLRVGLVNNIIVPSDARRAGNFSDLLPSRSIYDRSSGTPVAFPGNIIPPSRLSPQALAIQQYYPRQNTTTGTNSTAPSQSIDFNQYIVRFDHQITSKHRLFARWVYITQKEVDPNASAALGNAALTSWGQDIAVGVISNVSATMVNEARAHFLPSHVRLQGFLQGTDWNGRFGVAGFSDLLRPGVGGVFPDYAWSGYGSLQGSGFDQRPKSQDRKAFEGTDNFTILKGKQAIKFGVLFRYYQWLGYDSQNYAGSFTFNGNATSNNNSTSGDPYADFLLGFPSSVVRAYPANNFGGQGLYKQFFVQDDYRISDRLTINMGLRYEYSPWLDGYKGQIGTFDPTQSKPIIVSGTGPVPDLTSQFAAPAAYQYFGQYIQTSSTAGLPLNLTYTNKTQFAPRVGISYSVDRKTVIRTGFGMFYEPEGTSGRVNLNTLPYRLSETVNQTQNITPTKTLANFFGGSPLGSATATPSLGPTRTHLSMGTNIHYSLNVQRQFTDHDLFEIGYIANRGVHLSSSNDANVPRTPGAGAIQQRRPYPLWSGITYQTQDLSNHYDSLQTKFEHRFNRGFSALVAYTYSKTLQYNQSSALGGNTAYEYALAPYDIPHNIAISGSYQLPFGRKRSYMNNVNGLVDAIIGGWQAQTILVVRSGTPFTPVVGTDVANTGVANQRPKLNPAGGNPSFQRTLLNWYDRSRYMAAGNPALGIYEYGQVRANTLRSGVYNQFDASLFKNFSLPGESSLSFRAEFFNFPNTVSLAAPNNNSATSVVTSATGAQVTSSSNTPRQIQFALKYNF